MAFSDLAFLFLFLPVVLAGIYLLPGRCQDGLLLAASLIFYALGVRQRPWAIALFLGLCWLCWFGGRLLGAATRYRRQLLWMAVAVPVGCLLGFKYAGIFTGTAVWLPLGMSFYTFSMVGYLFDVYRGKVDAERSLGRFFTAQCMFPKLISGPLTPYGQIAPQLGRRRLDLRQLDTGLRTFILGLGMKVLLADRIGGLWRQLGAIGYQSISGPLAWMGLVAFSLQLYFDFHGYSTMAVGLGQMLGLSLPQNFAHPYAAKSMTDFWRRWHITLSSWFRDYVYIPLGGSRRGRPRQICNLLAVWVLTGMWHGSTVNILLWGLFLFLLLAAEKLWLYERLQHSRVLGHLYMALCIPLSWMLFAIPDLGQLGVYAQRLWGGFSAAALAGGDFVRYGGQYGLLLVLGLILCMPGPARLWRRVRHTPLATGFLLVVFWACCYCLSAGLNDPFMYFSF